MAKMTELHVNGSRRCVEVYREQPLLFALREEVGLTGCKIGCGEGECGVCTVLLNGEPTRSCVTPVSAVDGKRILTIEGLEEKGRLHPMQQAFLDCEALQCGYCTSGMILSAIGLLQKKPTPTEHEIVAFMHGNICRCGCYPRIVRAIRQAAALMSASHVKGGVG